MLQIRIHGRGGQGAVVASQILSYAFFLQGQYAQSFPTFGAERRGAPVAAFVRASDRFIDLRCQVTQPTQVLVLSGKLAETVDVTSGLREQGLLLINSHKPEEYFRFLSDGYSIRSVDISGIALRHGLGNRTMPMVNAPILGAFARISGLLQLDCLERSLPAFIPANLEGNKAALREAWEAAESLEAQAK
ncbi:MAG: 2-oxoacid:acceptor oxidoreductase family protein [Desulfohalobiaceae bacterium]|nr:2-oxoacid:acceptor oxidoreductase family protein [Desulfohalobiaceae bacterium]